MTVPAAIPGQIVPSGQQPYSNQQNFGQLIGEVSSYHTGMGASLVQNFINNAVRVYYDRRYWYGLSRKGVIQTPGYYSTGSVALTLGSASVQGINTAWTANLGGLPIVGQQLRIGFTAPIYTIIGLDQVHQVLTLELPWAMPSVSSTGYFISQYFYSFSNIRFFFSVKNLLMMYRLVTNISQSFIENVDPSRLQMLYPRVLASMPPAPNGNWMGELWPVPNTQQALPYLAYTIPSNLVNDDDNLPPFVRCDIIKAKAISDALMYRPKSNSNYSEAMCLSIAQQKIKEFEVELEHAAQMDEGLWRQDVISFMEMSPTIDPYTGSIAGGGGFIAAMTPQMADDY